MDTKKHNTDHYEPNDWELTPSEKRLKAIKVDITKKTKVLSEEEQNKTTNIMSNIKENDEEHSLFKKQSCPKIESEKYIETIFDLLPEPDEKPILHSCKKDESDMIAVEPKDRSGVQKVQIGFRVFILRFKQMIKNLFRVLILLLLL